jgi:hypothetical protein
MTETCAICQHPKIQAINAALLSGRYFAVVSHQFRLDKEAMRVHAMEHHFRIGHETRYSETSLAITIDEASPLQVSNAMAAADTQAPVEAVNTLQTWIDQALPHFLESTAMVTENPWRQFTRAIDTAVEAYLLAHDDPKMQARMQERLEEKVKLMLRSDDMGIS